MAALSVSLAMLVAIAVMIGSFRETVIYWVGQTLRADLYVATARRSNLDAQATISPALEQAIAGDPDVDGVDRFRALSVTFRDRLIVLGSGDFRVLLDHGALVFKAPADGPGALASAIGRDAVVVSESLSLRFGVAGRRPHRRADARPARARFRSRPSTTTTRPTGASWSWIARRSSATSATSARPA